jgi:type VI protein secretion system component Hcp
MELLHFDVSAMNAGTLTTGGRLTLAPLTFTKATDTNSPVLFRYCATGVRCDRVTLYVTKNVGSTGTEIASEIITLGNVVVSSIADDSTSGDNMTTESIAMTFGQMERRVYPFSATGTRGTPTIYGWDTQTNSPWNAGTPDGPG